MSAVDEMYPVDCPFCSIAEAYPAPASPSKVIPTTIPTTSASPTAYVLLNTPQVLAFLDHAPISRGHLLLIIRKHREKLSDLRVQEGQVLGSWLGILSRAVVGTVDPTGVDGETSGRLKDDVGDWNIVQNNGARAAQVVPHVHFHIIPRSGAVPEVKARSWTIFGRGQREDLDDEDAKVLIDQMRRRLRKELERLKEREGSAALELLHCGSSPSKPTNKL